MDSLMKVLKLALLPLCLTALATACADSTTSPVAPSGPLSPGGSAAKPAPSTTAIPGAVTFSDRPGDAITSDGLGTYVDGGRLEVSFYTASKDLVMRGGSRTLNLNHENRISGTGAIGTTQVSDIFMNIHHILDMKRGDTRVVAATFKRVNTEFFHFNEAYDSDATKVTVVRDAAGAWTVTADPDTDRTALIKKGTAIGLYAMPFQLTAVCPTCPEAN